MNTVLARGNAILAFSLSVVAALTFCCFLSTVLNDNSRRVSIRATNVAVKNVADFSVGREKNDLGHLAFDLDADLSSLFNWNAKQLFLYLVAEYSTVNNKFNEVVLWDKIVRRGEDANIRIKNIYTKYYFWDDGNGLRGNRNVTLSLRWNIIPNAGLLPNIQSTGSHSIVFPAQYASKAAQ